MEMTDSMENDELKNTNREKNVNQANLDSSGYSSYLFERKYIIVDLFSGSYNLNNFGHELFNDKPNQLDGRFYGYVPDYDNPNIDKLGASKGDSYIDDVLVLFVKKISTSNDRIVTGFYPNARIHRSKKSGERLNRSFPDKDGTIKIASYSIESDKYVPVDSANALVINVQNFSPWMFRKQRVYCGTYPKLDKLVHTFMNSLTKKILLDDDFESQVETQQALPATNEQIKAASTRELIEENTVTGKIIKKDPKLSKSAIVIANYLCAIDPNHVTFENANGHLYMEGHHLIPGTILNAKAIWQKNGRNIDCVENIVSLCPNCHRAIHYGKPSVQAEMLAKLYTVQESKLSSVGIHITFDDLLSYYNDEAVK